MLSKLARWEDGLVSAVMYLAAGILVLATLFYLSAPARARDPEGKYANSPLKEWFDGLASQMGPCCSFADGETVKDVDWDTAGSQDCTKTAGIETCKPHYRVRLHGQWIDVPDNALITEPNKYGQAVVWPYKDSIGDTKIRCFIPGAGA
jgi:hypothetical protein